MLFLQQSLIICFINYYVIWLVLVKYKINSEVASLRKNKKLDRLTMKGSILQTLNSRL